MNNLMIIGTFFFLWLAVFFEDSVESIFAYILILSFGILHGANDLKLLQKSNRAQGVGKKNVRLLVYYILFVLASLTVFYFIPDIALLLFILFSAYHFGEQHWILKVQKISLITHSFFVFYGLFILFLLFNAHEEVVTGIIENITGYNVLPKFYFIVSVVTGSITIAIYCYAIIKEIVNSVIFLEAFYLLLFFVVFSTASLLWAFAIYFILWHSLPSLAGQIIFLYGNLSGNSIKKYIVSSFPYWLISVLGLCLLLFIFRDNFETSLSFFFSFLAAITFPHVLVINRLNSN